VTRPAFPGIQAVIFDMDGVLVDTEPRHFAALNAVLAAEGYRLDPEDNRLFLGLTLERTWDLVVERFGLIGSRRDYHDHYDRAVLAELEQPLDPAPGVRQLLKATRAAGLALALASSSRRAWVTATLRSLGLAGCFPVTVAGDEVTVGKPDPEIFLTAARRLGIRPEHCLVIEDSPAGIEAARRAGMRVIAVRTPLTEGLVLPADRVVSALTELSPDRWLPPTG
jgi:HAD superfamily hydrolase (TIGR01509 family)